MNFHELAQVFKAGPSGTDQFKLVYKGAFQCMRSDPGNAALYFVVGVAAQAYVMKFEDQAVAPDTAHKSKAKIEIMLDAVVNALGGSAEDRLRAANEIATEYEWRIREF